MVFSEYKLQWILYFCLQGYKAPTISCLLAEEGLCTSRVGIAKFLKKYQQTGNISRRPGSGRPSKIMTEIKTLVEQKMCDDDETTAVQLYTMLKDHGYNISLQTILRCRSSLVWTFRGSKYCRLIRAVNKVKRFEWASQYMTESFDPTVVFNDVVWTDECLVQLESHWRFCCRKWGEPPKNKPR